MCEKFPASPIPLLTLEAQVVICGMVGAIVPVNQRSELFGECFKLANALLKLNEARAHYLILTSVGTAGGRRELELVFTPIRALLGSLLRARKLAYDVNVR